MKISISNFQKLEKIYKQSIMKLLLILSLQNIKCGKLKVSGPEDNFVDQIQQLVHIFVRFGGCWIIC